MVRHLGHLGEVERHNSWGKKPPTIAVNAFSFSETALLGGFVTLTKNEGGTFSPPRSRPSTPTELGRKKPKTPPGFRSRSVPRARTPPRSRPRTPPRLRKMDSPRKSSRANSPHIRGARRNSQKPSDSIPVLCSGSPAFLSPSPATDDALYIPSSFVYDEIRDPPPQTETDRDVKQEIGETLYGQQTDTPMIRTTPSKDPSVAQMSSLESDSIRAESFDLPETKKITTKMSSKNQSVATQTQNSNHLVNQLHSPSSLERRNSNIRRNRATSPQLQFRKRSKSPLRNIRLSFPKSKGDRANQPKYKQATGMNPCVEQSSMASPENMEIAVKVEDVNPIVEVPVDSQENAKQTVENPDNDYGFVKVISGALSYWTRLEPKEDPGEKEEKNKTVLAPSIEEVREQLPEAPKTDLASVQVDASAERENLGSADIVFHVRLNVESFIGVSTIHRSFRRHKNDHSLMQGYVEVVNPSIVAKNSSSIVASQPNIATTFGTSKHHCFIWPDNVKDKARNRLYLTLPVYHRQDGGITTEAIEKPETAHLRIGVKRGEDLIPLGDAFLEIDIDCPNMHDRTVELPIQPLKKENKNKIRGLFSKKKVNDKCYGLDQIAVLRCIVQAQPGLESPSGTTFWGDKPLKRNTPEQGVVHELCSQDSETNPQSQQASHPWNTRTTRDKERELFLSPDEAELEVGVEEEPPDYFAASPFVKDTLGKDSTERNRDRVEQVRYLPSPVVAQQSEGATRNLDKIERLRSPTSTGAHWSLPSNSRGDFNPETEANRNDAEQTRTSQIKDSLGKDRDHPENQDTDSDAGSVTDAGCTTFWTLGNTRITAKVGTLKKKKDPGLGTMGPPCIEQPSSQSLRRDLYQIPETTVLIDGSKNLSLQLFPPMCKSPHNKPPVDHHVKVTFEEMEDRTWQARMRSNVQQDDQYDMTDVTEDGSAALQVEEPPSKLRTERIGKGTRPLPTDEEDKFKAVSTDDQFVSIENGGELVQQDEIATEAKEQVGSETKSMIDNRKISNVNSVLRKDTKGSSPENLESWMDTQGITADSLAISETDSVSAELMGDEISPKPSHRRHGLKPDPPSRKMKAQKDADRVDISLETLKTETKDEADGAEEFSWITDTTKAVDPDASMTSGPASNVEALNQMQDRCITPSHLSLTELTLPKQQEPVEHQPSAKIPDKLPTRRNIGKQFSDEFTEWVDADPESTSRRMPFFNCICDDLDDASDHETNESRRVDTPETLLRNFPSFATTEGFETVLDLKRERDPGYSMIETLSNLSKGLFWPAAKKEEAADLRNHPTPKTALSSSSSSSGSLGFVFKDRFSSPKRKYRFPSETRRQPSGSSNAGFFQQKQVSDISNIESIPSPVSAESYPDDCSDSKYDEAARKIFRVAKKLGISADDLINQLEKGEKLEKLLSQKIQVRQKNSTKRSGRKYRSSGYV